MDGKFSAYLFFLRAAGRVRSGTSSPSAVARSIWWSCSCTRICLICSAMANSLSASHCLMRSRDTAIGLWREYQHTLAQHGVSRHAIDLGFRLMHALGVTLIEPDHIEMAFERLHRAAYPDASTRPARLHSGERESILE